MFVGGNTNEENRSLICKLTASPRGGFLRDALFLINLFIGSPLCYSRNFALWYSCISYLIPRWRGGLIIIYIISMHPNYIYYFQNGARGEIRTHEDICLPLTRRVQSATMRLQHMYSRKEAFSQPTAHCFLFLGVVFAYLPHF